VGTAENLSPVSGHKPTGIQTILSRTKSYAIMNDGSGTFFNFFGNGSQIFKPLDC